MQIIIEHSHECGSLKIDRRVELEFDERDANAMGALYEFITHVIPKFMQAPDDEGKPKGN